LRVGEVTQTVTVTGEAPLVETTTATVANLVDEKRVEDLPLNNRDLTQLAFLQPGVVQSPQTGDANTGMGAKFSVAGTRGTQHLFLLDGVSSGDFSGNPQGASSSYMGAETVKEFQVITNNYSAEYKSQAGAIISAVTKSGTNSFHGSLFEFHRNDNLDAAKWEANRTGEPKPEFKRNQFGGSLGGPIVRDRTFFFTSYEGLRERLGTISLARVPTAQARLGILPGRTVTVNSAVQPYVQLWPVPGQGNSISRDFGDGTVEVAGQGRRPTDSDFVAAKIDHRFTREKLGYISGTYNFDDSESLSAGVLGDLAPPDGSANSRHIVSVGHTSILSPTIVSVFNFGFSHTEPTEYIFESDRDWSNLRFVPQRTLMGVIAITDVATIGHEYDPAYYGQNTVTLKEGLTLAKGNHSFRVGAELTRIRNHAFIPANGYNGQYMFNNLQDFLTNVPFEFAAQLPGPGGVEAGQRDLGQIAFGAYFQDNYTVRPSLTLNLGLRHEFTTIAKEDNDEIANLVDFYDPETTVGKFITNATLKSFSPRIGFAWAPGSRRTSLRGGFGIFYEHPNMYIFQNMLSQVPPFAKVGILRAAQAQALGTQLVFPNTYRTQIDLLAGRLNVWPMQYKQNNTYIYRWSLTAQRELGASWMVSAGYTGSRGLHLNVQTIDNIYRWQGWPNQPDGPKFFPAVTQPNFINPAFVEIRSLRPAARSSYHGLALAAQNRLTRGLVVQLSYTFSKAIDDGSGTTGSDNFPQGQRTIFHWDWNMNKGPAGFDVRNNFVANFSYEVPLGENLSGIGAAIVKGWQANGIITLSSGYPLTILEARTAQLNRMGFTTGLRPDLAPNGNSNPIEGTTAGCTGIAEGLKVGTPDLYYDPCQFQLGPVGFFGNLGKGTVTAPGLATVDFSVSKNFEFTEANRLQFRAEFFNLFNRPNFGAPDTTPWTGGGGRDANVGRVASTRGTARQVQFGLKYIF
jgi:hypothetical protein